MDDFDTWNNCDPLGIANHHTFGFLENDSYVFDGSLFSLLGDHSVKFQEEIVKHFKYVSTFLDTYVKNLVERILVDKPLMVVNGDAELELSCFDLKCWHDVLDIHSLVADSFSSCTPMWGMIPSNFLDLYVGKFIVKKVKGYLCSLIGDLLDKSIRRNVERCSYMIPFFETFVITFKELALSKTIP
ncbi:hypothetical protein M9H77_17750 [Catharanthus roseus]|uniref:Uncharacterized protein n=1 Tax=Catharanthus roseus TaxID=4058 RepID=A0ACC0B5P9_CATRO|nr:hypothetical protein M9H77_17750 [Catharanthus roseus]